TLPGAHLSARPVSPLQAKRPAEASPGAVFMADRDGTETFGDSRSDGHSPTQGRRTPSRSAHRVRVPVIRTGRDYFLGTRWCLFGKRLVEVEEFRFYPLGEPSDWEQIGPAAL